MTFEVYSETRVQMINQHIQEDFERFARTTSQRFSLLTEAMRYTLEGGRKRLRPLLVLASAEALG